VHFLVRIRSKGGTEKKPYGGMDLALTQQLAICINNAKKWTNQMGHKIRCLCGKFEKPGQGSYADTLKVGFPVVSCLRLFWWDVEVSMM